MDNSFGQADRPKPSPGPSGQPGSQVPQGPPAPAGRPAPAPAGRPASAGTRQRLLAAAAELIAEVGWGRVTTRAVAERAGLPHGAVSYHFRGKQELLVEAALHAFEQAVPMAEFAALQTIEDLIGLIGAELGDGTAINPRLAGLMMEAMREAERDEMLRERMGGMLSAYRQLMTDVVRADQQRGVAYTGASAEGIATVLAAVGDGLLLHVLLDPEFDFRAGLETLHAILRARPL